MQTSPKFALGVLFACAFLAAALTYLPCARYAFVSCDDPQYVYDNERVMNGISADNVKWAITSCGYAYNWHPLAWISLQTDVSITKALRGMVDKNALSHVMHAHNIALHAANTALLFLLLVLLLNSLPNPLPPSTKHQPPSTNPALHVSLLLALLWGIHPLRTEVVCWVSERKELTSVFFMLLTFILYILPRRSPSTSYLNPHFSFFTYHFSLLTFLLALSAKPVAVTLPAVLFAWDWIMREKPFGRTFLRILPFGLLSAATCVLTMAAQVEAKDVGNQFAVLDKVIMAVTAPIIYLRQTLLPVNLSVFYAQFSTTPWIELALGVLLLAAMGTVVVLWLIRRDRRLALPCFGIAWAYVSLLPMLGIVKVGDQPHSDRYTYWAGCALVGIVLLATRRIVAGYERNATIALAAVLAASFFATRARLPVWRNSLALYIDSAPKSWAMQPVRALARELIALGDEGTAQAERLVREALTHTDYCDIHAELAILVAMRVEKSQFRISDGPDPAFYEARLEAERALSGNPDLWRAHAALGIVEMKEGNWAEAIPHLERALAAGEAVDNINSFIATCREHLNSAKKGK